MESKILIVDDEVHICLLLEQTLEEFEDQGVEILTANSGEEALELIKTEKPALVFLDVMLPKINGFDICHTVKHELGLDEVYIIMLTAKGQEYDKQKGADAGADIYMIKPFDPDEIVEKAAQVLNLD